MGLPLFIPPVESDVPAKLAPKCPAYARSAIRRSHDVERRRQYIVNAVTEARTRRLRNNLNSAQPTDNATSRRVRNGRQHPSLVGRSPRLENPRVSELSLDLERRYWGRTTTEPSRLATEDTAGHASSSRHPDPESLETQTREWDWFAAAQQDFQESLHNTYPDDEVTRYRHRGGATRSGPPQGESSSDSSGLRDAMRRHVQRARSHAQRVRYHDGLGDRDRSLSPEGDGVWDTLQSTLTPDPQPPSVGSSFSSTIVSAVPSEAHGTDSANTSMTTPDDEIEPPCDPILDPQNADSDCEDNSGEPLGEPSRQPTPHNRRSYADVVAESQSAQTPDAGDTVDHDREWLSSMHQIIRGLASHDDIPDEWWAEAGLSRSFSWEDSA
ncbi:hypothetical protein F4808DRAFT_3642 [Astrocystis sublimbata]|nr:hypothetical protein F4808DRAFT_3642 [Astrocystis sublimbata]